MFVQYFKYFWISVIDFSKTFLIFQVQCYKSAGYCWCVNEDTGKNIPGTSVKNATAKCDDLPTRPMKGCPEEKKLAFLKDLMQFLQNKMNTTSAFTDSMWRASKEEQTAKFSFVMLDKNQNKMLDKHEWKSFKDMVLEMKTFKKCGKKLPRYCDINRDRQISLTEWLLCLNVQQGELIQINSSPQLLTYITEYYLILYSFEI